MQPVARMPCLHAELLLQAEQDPALSKAAQILEACATSRHCRPPTSPVRAMPCRQ